MLRTYGPNCEGGLIDATRGGVIQDSATWIDLEEPTKDEERLVEKCLGIGIPTREDMIEIEPSSRLYEKNGALYLTISVLYGVSDGRPSSEPVSFVLSGNRLVTIRYVTPKPLRAFSQHARVEPEVTRDAMTVFARLLDAVIERLADELEDAGTEIEAISSHIFRRDRKEGGRVPVNRLEALLTRIGRTQSLVSTIRETGVSTSRLLSFVSASERLHQPDIGRAREQLASLAADTNALTDHSGFLMSQLVFLLDASLGFISIEQNAAMKLFSWAALIFLPPTLVAGIYGMNFEHMPELDWLYGYPMALGLILASAILPIWYFKLRRWI